MAKEKIYTVFDDGKRIGSYTPDVAEMAIGIPKSKVSVYAKNEKEYLGRYTFQLERGYGKGLDNDWEFTMRFMKLMAKEGWKRGSR